MGTCLWTATLEILFILKSYFVDSIFPLGMQGWFKFTYAHLQRGLLLSRAVLNIILWASELW